MEQNQDQTVVLEQDALTAFFAGEDITPQAPKEDIGDIVEFFKEKEQKAPEKIETPPLVDKVETPTENKYALKIKEYIEEGFFQDADIEVENEAGEKVKVALSELTDLTLEEFKAIKEEQKRLKDEEIGEKYISTEGLDDRTKKMIELKRAGGDLTPLLEQEVEYRNAFEGVDLEQEAQQEFLVRQKLTNQGLHPKVVEAQIEAMKEDLTLDVEAKKIKADYDAWFDAQIEAKRNEQLEKINAEKEQQKEFRKSLNSALKDLNIKNESVAKVLLDNSTKLNEYGLTNTDILYFNSKDNPELHAKLSLFLNNEEEFNKFMGQKVETKVKVETARKLLSLTPRQKASPAETPKDKTKDAVQEFFKQ